MNRTALHRPLLAAVAAAVLLAACGGGSSSKPSGSSTSSTTAGSQGTTSKSTTKTPSDDALCKIITAEDAAKLFGEPAQRKPATGPAAGSRAQCLYHNPDDGLNVRNLLQVRVYPAPQYSGERVYPGAKKLSGLGDKAFVSTKGPGSSVEIQFVQGGRTVSINYSAGNSVDTASKVSELEAIAHKVSDNL